MKYPAILIFVCLLTACSGTSRLEQALALAGENRAELEKVLQHYSQNPADKLKYKAAEFLIKNMPGHYTFTGPDVDSYYRRLDSVFSLSHIDYYELDSVLKEMKTADFHEKKIQDIKRIKASFLINHIDHAFETQKYPWRTKLSFSDFCEHILPYRFSQEPVEDWIPVCMERIKERVNLPVQTETSDSLVCIFLFNQLMHPPTDIDLGFSPVFDYSPSELLRVQTERSVGSCKELSLLGMYSMHSFGIPVTYDFTPQWANRSRSHSWNTVIFNSQLMPFQMKDHSVPFGKHLANNPGKYVKVYRKMYSIQKESLALRNYSEDIPSFFKDMHMKDVTPLYGECIDLDVKLTVPATVNPKTAYLMLYDNKEWKPVHWAEIKKGKATFDKVKKVACVYMIMYYKQGIFHPASFPVYVNNDGTKKILRPNTDKTISVRLKRKHPNLNVSDIPDKVRNGKLQGANKQDFSDAFNLHIIDSIEDVVPQTVLTDHPGEFRYFRYLSADSGYVNMAEIALYDKEGEKLSGGIIGTDDAILKMRDKTKVFDGKIITYFKSRHPSGGWVGLDFKKKKNIGKIIYCPRNDENFIKEGDNYELFYYENGWKSIGKKTGTETGGELIYDDVPTEALLLLKNHSGGTEERPFTYENGKQVWW